MAAVASVFVAVPPKRTWDVDMTLPIRKYIKRTYEEIDKADYTGAVADFNKLRTIFIAKSGERVESALEVLYRLATLSWVSGLIVDGSVCLS